MYKLSQRELLEEGLWDSFKKGVNKVANTKLGRLTKQAIQLGKEVGKFVAPNTSSQLANMVSGTRSGYQRIRQAGKTIEERILDWMDEQGFVPIPNDIIKMGKNTPKGQHYTVKVAQKGITPEGNSVAGKKFRYPQAIVLFDKDKNVFEWVIKPRFDAFMKETLKNGLKRDAYWDDNARPVDDGSVDDGSSATKERILDWMDKQGIVLIPNEKIKTGTDTPKGQHYLVKVAQKGVTPTGKTVAGKKFRYPQAIVLFDRDKNSFDWVVKPRWDQFMKDDDGEDAYWNNDARPVSTTPPPSTTP
jgi:hypothetical protein